MSIASYSASLFEAEKPNLMDCFSLSPEGDMRTTLASSLFFFEDPTTYIIHVSPFLMLSVSRLLYLGSLMMKSTNTWPLRLCRGLYSIPNLPSSMAHLTNRPERSNICKTTYIGWSVRTTMACAWKYGLIFLAVVCSDKATFSSLAYRVSALRRVFLMKYISC